MRKFLLAAILSLAAAGCQTAGTRYSRDDKSERSMLRDQTIRLNGFYNLARDCRLIGIPDVRIVSSTSGGQLAGRTETGFPSFRDGTPQAACNTRRSPARAVYYAPRPGFVGSDQVVFEVFWKDGEVWRETYTLTVR